MKQQQIIIAYLSESVTPFHYLLPFYNTN